MPNWSEYLRNTADKPTSVLLKEAIPYVKTKGHALDFGAGNLQDTRLLLHEGFAVDVLDSNPEVENIAKDLPVEVHIEDFETFAFPVKKYDLINAQYSVPFIKPGDFERVWNALANSLVERGVFVGQFFGEEDDWANNSNMTFQSKAELEGLFDNWNIIKLEEVKKQGKTASDKDKFWHVFHVIAVH